MISDKQAIDLGWFAEIVRSKPTITSRYDEAARNLACDVLRMLVRREAEQAERAKPIDAEWLKSLGFYCETKGSRFFEHSEIPGVFHFTIGEVLAWRCEVYGLFEAITRGQLLDLLTALKGGAS